VGVFFITQLPDDVPDEILAQLGNRIQHALRAFTPRDAKALKAAVTTYPKTKDYDLEEDLTQLGTGEAMVTILSERGAPTPVVWTRMAPPRSLMAAIGPEAVTSAGQADPLWVRYGTEIERESAREKWPPASPRPQSPHPRLNPRRSPLRPRRSDVAGPGATAATRTRSSTTSRRGKARPWSRR